MVSRPPTGGDLRLIPTEPFTTAHAKPGVTVSFYKDENFTNKITQITERNINFSVPLGAKSDASLTTTEKYNVRWEAQLILVVDGDYYVELQTSGADKVAINGQSMITLEKNSGGHDKI